MTGPELRQIRSRLHLSARKLGWAIGVHERTIYKWERGERTIPQMAVNLINILIRSGEKKDMLANND